MLRSGGEGIRGHQAVDHEEVARLNTTIVRCAEDVVFYSEATWAPTERGSVFVASFAVARADDVAT